MFFLFIPAAIYIAISLISPMRMPLWLKIGLAALFLLGAFRAQWLNLFWPSSDPMLPEGPYYAMLIGSSLYTAVLIFAQLTALRDLLCWPVAIFRRLFFGKKFHLPFQQTGLIVLLLGGLTTAFTMWQSLRVPEVKEVSMAMPSLPEDIKELRVIVIADTHLSPLLDEAYAQAVAERVNAQNPDLILFVGDVMDGPVDKRQKALDALGAMKARYGVYVSPGNHEYYINYNAAMDAYRALGWITLENENTEAIKGLSLIGVCDYVGVPRHHPDYAEAPGVELKSARRGVPAGNASILLGHNPAVAAIEDISGIDLILSGHTHGGMMPGPVMWYTDHVSFDYTRGYYQVYDTSVYVTAGAGTWPGATLRVHVAPEIILLKLTR